MTPAERIQTTIVPGKHLVPAPFSGLFQVPINDGYRNLKMSVSDDEKSRKRKLFGGFEKVLCDDPTLYLKTRRPLELVGHAASSVFD